MQTVSIGPLHSYDWIIRVLHRSISTGLQDRSLRKTKGEPLLGVSNARFAAKPWRIDLITVMGSPSLGF